MMGFDFSHIRWKGFWFGKTQAIAVNILLLTLFSSCSTNEKNATTLLIESTVEQYLTVKDLGVDLDFVECQEKNKTCLIRINTNREYVSISYYYAHVHNYIQLYWNKINESTQINEFNFVFVFSDRNKSKLLFDIDRNKAKEITYMFKNTIFSRYLFKYIINSFKISMLEYHDIMAGNILNHLNLYDSELNITDKQLKYAKYGFFPLVLSLQLYCEGLHNDSTDYLILKSYRMTQGIIIHRDYRMPEYRKYRQKEIRKMYASGEVEDFDIFDQITHILEFCDSLRSVMNRL